MTDTALTLRLRAMELAEGTSSFDDAFRVEFERHHASLARYLTRLTSDPAASADLAQEAFVRLYTRGAMPDDPRAWLVTVAHNLLRNAQRQSNGRARILKAHAAELAADREEATPEMASEVADQRARVRAAIETLSDRDRRLLLLRYEGLSYRELALAVGISEVSVGTLLARAKDAFRRALGNRGDGGARASD